MEGRCSGRRRGRVGEASRFARFPTWFRCRREQRPENAMNFQRLKVSVRGAVQGVGFRPFIYRLATQLGLNGWVSNSAQGVFIEAEGVRDVLRQFLLRIEKEKPPRASIQSLESCFLDAVGYDRFEISHNDQSGPKTVLVLPDIATCPDCLREILEPKDRRYRYPFTNCTNCGPRFTIVEALPYDRPNTSMKRFAMCADCYREYSDPLDRRFHAQPVACPSCGPNLELWDAGGSVIAQRDDALMRGAQMVSNGKIVALKGIGGFQLIVDARNESAIRELRARKRREEKPLGLMYPSIELVRQDCQVSELEERLLLSPESPIVLLRSMMLPMRLGPSVAPGNPCYGVMLPYSPLHHLFMRELGFPVVATSGNLSDEPFCIDEREALKRLTGIADYFLVHDRPIVRQVDDSVVRLIRGRELVLRRARGYAPMPVHLREPLPVVLAVGAHLKNSVCLSVGTQVFISQHIGDLETAEAFSAFRNVVADFQRLYEASPDVIACDMHPDYLSTRYAAQLSASPHFVQHHWAHVLACMADNQLEPPVLGVSWDGTGYGSDGTIWGGEFLLAQETGFQRAGHFRQFRLPGGDAAVREPRRAALGVLYEALGENGLEESSLAPVRDFSARKLALIRQMLAKGFNSPLTSSVGRLFDAVASLLGLRQRASFEGQAAMELEFSVPAGVEEIYPFQLRKGPPCIVDWQPTLREILIDLQKGQDAGIIAAKFHNTLVETIVAVAREIGEQRIVLTGGCFQNRYLTERAVQRLLDSGFRCYWHQRVPPNDGGIAPGQVISAAIAYRRRKVLQTVEAT
jgi:hydrogenase maturation protein HypF